MRPDWWLSLGSYDHFVEVFHVFEQFWFSSEASTPTTTIPTSFDWWFLRLMLCSSVHGKPTKRGLALFVTTCNVNSKGLGRFQMNLGPLDSEDRDSTIRLIPWTRSKRNPTPVKGMGFLTEYETGVRVVHFELHEEWMVSTWIFTDIRLWTIVITRSTWNFRFGVWIWQGFRRTSRLDFFKCFSEFFDPYVEHLFFTTLLHNVLI